MEYEPVVSMPAGLQDTFLAECKRQGTPVTVYLVNGFQLRGIVKGFDPFTVLVEYDRKTHLVYKHAISTISPGLGVATSHVETTTTLASVDGAGEE